MTKRLFLLIPMVALALSAQTASKKPIPRAADGHPDLQGVWTNATLTPMERPASFARQVESHRSGSQGVREQIAG